MEKTSNYYCAKILVPIFISNETEEYNCYYSIVKNENKSDEKGIKLYRDIRDNHVYNLQDDMINSKIKIKGVERIEVLFPLQYVYENEILDDDTLNYLTELFTNENSKQKTFTLNQKH